MDYVILWLFINGMVWNNLYLIDKIVYYTHVCLF